MEGYTLRQEPLAALRGPSPLLKLAGDERLIALTRSGQQAAFEALVSRYQARLLAFIRHMVRSREDAEDVLQEVFAAAFNAIMADTRAINARPWLYRIARNRALNHLRRATAVGVDDMDAHFADAGLSTSEKVHRREEFRLLLEDISHLPETQRSALVLREMDALSYEQIADVMDTTVPSVKSLLVRARVGLAEAAEARKLTCDEVRLELGAAAEGLGSPTAAIRRHVKQCDRCRSFRSQLRTNNRALAAIMPIGPLILFKKVLLVKLGLAKLAGGSSAATAGAGAGGGTVVAAAGGTAAVGAGGAAAGAVAVKVAVVAVAAAVAVGTTTNVFHPAPAHHAPPPSALKTASAVPAPPTAQTITQRAKRASMAAPRHFGRVVHPVVPFYAPALIPAAAIGSIVVVPASPPTTTDTTPSVPSTPVVTTVTPTPPPTAPPPSTATPTTQEISTTTVFPSSSTGSTGTSGIPVAGGTTGSTGSTGPASSGSTGASGSSSTTGSTGTVSSSTYPSTTSGSASSSSTYPASGGSASPGQGGPATSNGSSIASPRATN